MALVPVTADFVLPNALAINTRAIHGVAQTLNIILTGKRTLVIAYAVATSIKILLPVSPACHFCCTFSASAVAPCFLISRVVSCASVFSIASLLNPNQPFLAKYRPNFETPSETYEPSSKNYTCFVTNAFTASADTMMPGIKNCTYRRNPSTPVKPSRKSDQRNNRCNLVQDQKRHDIGHWSIAQALGVGAKEPRHSIQHSVDSGSRVCLCGLDAQLDWPLDGRWPSERRKRLPANRADEHHIILLTADYSWISMTQLKVMGCC